MGVSLFAVFDKEFPEYDVTAIEGKILSRLTDIPLISPLMAYVSVSQDEYADLMEEAEPEHIDSNFEEQWFDSNEGLAKVESILKTLTTETDNITLPPEAKD